MSTTLRTFAARFVAATRTTVRHLAVREDGLADLDDRALADIGVTRSEIESIEAEAHSARRPTRLRIVAGMRHA